MFIFFDIITIIIIIIIVIIVILGPCLKDALPVLHINKFI